MQKVWPDCPLPDYFHFNQTVELISYNKPESLNKENNLFSDYDLPKQKQENEEPQLFLPHLKPAISMYVLYDDIKYLNNLQDVNAFLSPFLRTD